MVVILTLLQLSFLEEVGALQVLRESIEEAIKSLSNKDIRLVEFDSQKDEEKTLVAEGAIAQVSKFDIPTSKVKIKSRRLYASYGIMFQELGGHLHYVELLNHNDIPYAKTSGYSTARISMLTEHLHLLISVLYRLICHPKKQKPTITWEIQSLYPTWRNLIWQISTMPTNLM